jgi:glutaredoxin
MDWLDRQGVTYEEKNIDDPKDAVLAEEMVGQEIDLVPVTLIGDDVIVNFDRPAIIKSLNKYGLKK